MLHSNSTTLGSKQEKHTKCAFWVAYGVPHILIPRKRYSSVAVVYGKVAKVLKLSYSCATVVLQFMCVLSLCCTCAVRRCE
jgi:hypothetical protein